MSIPRSWIAAWIAAFALAVTLPFVHGLAQGPQGGQAKGGGPGKPPSITTSPPVLPQTRRSPTTTFATKLSSNGPRAAGVVPSGNQIGKYSPAGKILMKMLAPGVYGTDNAHFSQPSDVVTAPNGDIFVADGHDRAPSNNRIMKFDKTGKFIKAWGK